MGIEVDEALIGSGIYERALPWYSWHLFGGEIPVMLITYLGALKVWFYNVLFLIWEPGPVALRLPTVIAGVVTLALFFVFTDRTLGRTAAWFATALLATDPMFVLTESIDFGFVALQHVFKLGALLLLFEFHRRRERRLLAAAFFLFGLAMWDKAVFSWLLAGIAVAGLIVFWREVRSHLTFSNVRVAAAGFCAGALPLILYNIDRPLETFRMSAKFSLENAFIKVVVLKRTFDGSGLFGFYTFFDPGPTPGVPKSVIQHVGFRLSSSYGPLAESLTLYAFIGTLFVVPLLWRTPSRRPVCFAIVLMLITWIQMFLTAGAGAGVHHVILLWPFHLFVIAAAAVSLLRKRAVAALGIVLCTSHVLVMNHYHVALIRNGPTVRWTNAFTPLLDKLQNSGAKRIIMADWGILETLNLLSKGELPVEDASSLLAPGAQEHRVQQLLQERLAGERTIWVTHTDGHEQWVGVNANLNKVAEAAGYTRELLHTIHDRNGRAIFDIVRFRRG